MAFSYGPGSALLRILFEQAALSGCCADIGSALASRERELAALGVCLRFVGKALLLAGVVVLGALLALRLRFEVFETLCLEAQTFDISQRCTERRDGFLLGVENSDVGRLPTGRAGAGDCTACVSRNCLGEPNARTLNW